MYFRGSTLAHFFTHRLRPASVLLLLMAPASLFIIPEFNKSPIFQLRSFVLVILGVSFLLVLFRKAKITATRDVPRLATAGEPVTYQIKLTNTAKSKLSGWALLDMPPDDRPSLDRFHHSTPPNKSKNTLLNGTSSYYRWEWLRHQATLFSNKQSDTQPSIHSGKSQSVNLTLTPHKRGIIVLSDLRICLPDPLGIFQKCRKISAQKDQITVLPRRYRLPPFALLGSARFQLGGETASSSIGQSGDFTSIREYRAGDPIRHIHWKSWARKGKPIVKEYEDVFFPRYGLVLDTFSAPEDADLFEVAVSLAASFAASIDTKESLLDLMFIRGEAHHFTAGRGEERIDKMLELLAGIQSDDHPDFEALQKLILRYKNDLTTCICIFIGWSQDRCDTVKELVRSGVNLKIFSICKNSDDIEQSQKLYPSPAPIHFLRLGHIEKDLFSPPAENP